MSDRQEVLEQIWEEEMQNEKGENRMREVHWEEEKGSGVERTSSTCPVLQIRPDES